MSAGTSPNAANTPSPHWSSQRLASAKSRWVRPGSSRRAKPIICPDGVPVQRGGGVHVIAGLGPAGQRGHLAADHVLQVQHRAVGPWSPACGPGRSRPSGASSAPRPGPVTSHSARPSPMPVEDVGQPAALSRRSVRRPAARSAASTAPAAASTPPCSSLNTSTSWVGRSMTPWASSALPPPSANPCGAATPSAMAVTCFVELADGHQGPAGEAAEAARSTGCRVLPGPPHAAGEPQIGPQGDQHVTVEVGCRGPPARSASRSTIWYSHRRMSWSPRSNSRRVLHDSHSGSSTVPSAGPREVGQAGSDHRAPTGTGLVPGPGHVRLGSHHGYSVHPHSPDVEYTIDEAVSAGRRPVRCRHECFGIAPAAARGSSCVPAAADRTRPGNCSAAEPGRVGRMLSGAQRRNGELCRPNHSLSSARRPLRRPRPGRGHLRALRHDQHRHLRGHPADGRRLAAPARRRQ